MSRLMSCVLYHTMTDTSDHESLVEKITSDCGIVFLYLPSVQPGICQRSHLHASKSSGWLMWACFKAITLTSTVIRISFEPEMLGYLRNYPVTSNIISQAHTGQRRTVLSSEKPRWSKKGPSLSPADLCEKEFPAEYKMWACTRAQHWDLIREKKANTQVG